LTLEREQVAEYLTQLETESKAVKSEALKLCWYMRGGLTYDEAMFLSQQEREIIAKIISDNLETTKESGLPFF
jgi:hypothetical protein